MKSTILPATISAWDRSLSGPRSVRQIVSINSEFALAILYAFAEGGAVLTGMVAVVMVLPAAIVAPAVGGLGDGMRRGTALAGSYGIVAVATAATAVALATTSGVLMVVLGAAFVIAQALVGGAVAVVEWIGLQREPAGVA